MNVMNILAMPALTLLAVATIVTIIAVLCITSIASGVFTSIGNTRNRQLKLEHEYRLQELEKQKEIILLTKNGTSSADPADELERLVNKINQTRRTKK